MPCDSTAFKKKKINKPRSCWEQGAEPREAGEGWVILGTLQTRVLQQSRTDHTWPCTATFFCLKVYSHNPPEAQGKDTGRFGHHKAREASDISPAFKAGLVWFPCSFRIVYLSPTAKQCTWKYRNSCTPGHRSDPILFLTALFSWLK